MVNVSSNQVLMGSTYKDLLTFGKGFPASKQQNANYDFVFSNTLRSREYRILGKKGEGTFSEVLKCQHVKDGTYYACKKMKQKYDGVEQVNNLREIQAMRRLNPHTNIIGLHEIIYDKKTGTVALICELMDMNIYEMIRGRRHYLPEVKIKSYMYQLLKSIDHMHRCGIFHRDVKPENILVKDEVLKLADFGSCRSVYSKPPYTEYISTRWYRAPECLLTDGYYSYRMDLWSVGCVFFEVMSLHPLFPGSNEVDQIAKIHDVLGTPNASILNKMKHRNRGINFDFPPKKGTGIEKLIPHASQSCIELIYKMCTYDPDERITAKQALRHPYFRDFREQEKKKTASKAVVNEPQTNKKQSHESWRQAQIQKKREKLQESPKTKKDRLCSPPSKDTLSSNEDQQNSRGISQESSDSQGLIRGIVPLHSFNKQPKNAYPVHKTGFNKDKMAIEPAKFTYYERHAKDGAKYKLQGNKQQEKRTTYNVKQELFKADSKVYKHAQLNRELLKKRVNQNISNLNHSPKFKLCHKSFNPNYNSGLRQQKPVQADRDSQVKKAKPSLPKPEYLPKISLPAKEAICRPEKMFDLKITTNHLNQKENIFAFPKIENAEMHAESSKNKNNLDQILLRRQRRLAEQQQKSSVMSNSFMVKPHNNNHHQVPSFSHQSGPKSVYSSSLPKVHNYNGYSNKFHHQPSKVGNHLPRHQFAHHQPSSNMMLPGILKTNPILHPHGNKNSHVNHHLHHKTKIKKEPKSLYGQHYQLPSINRHIYH